MSSYSRAGYLAIVVEATENVAVTPTVFVPLMSEDIVTEWGHVPAVPISGNRTMNLRALKTAIAPPSGSLNILIEPKTFGHFLRGVYGTVNSGQLMRMTVASGDWAIGDTVTGGSSAKTATVAFVSSELDYLLVTSPSGAFTDGETITNASTGTGTLTQHDATVYGHEFTAPQASLPTYTVEIGYDNEAYRYTGVRFNGITVNQSDNILTAAINITARAEFKHGRVTAVTTAAGGSQTITVDQTTGLVAGDTIKLWSPSTSAFIDFSTTAVKTHTIDAVTSETTFTVTALETTTVVGDLIVLAPQTPSYVIDEEFTWIGASEAITGDDLTTIITGSVDGIEDFEVSLVNDIEAKHAANGVNVINRFPSKNFLKGLTGGGSITRTYTDMNYLDRLRNNTDTALYLKHTGLEIGSTGQNQTLEWRIPNVQFDPFNASLSEDDLIGQEMPFIVYDSSTDGFAHKALLVTDITSY